jgi:AMP-polyphosphate phosphotransferase
MFEAAELGRKISKKEFKARENELHTELLAVQRELMASKIPVVVLVSGVEGAGKGGVVNRLNEWLDVRGIQTYGFWDETDEERERPPFWRFWRSLPPRGTIGVFFGSWYTQPIIERVFGRLSEAAFEREMARVVDFEQTLSLDGALVIKFWFHLSKKDQKKRLANDTKLGIKSMTTSLLKKYAKRYDAFISTSERAIRLSDSGLCPWYVIEASDERYRDLTVGSTLLRALKTRLHEAAVAPPPMDHSDPAVPEAASARITILDKVDLHARLSPSQYSRRLTAGQQQLRSLAWKAKKDGRHTIAVFEGWDAAGKGGAIRRVTAAMDARLFRVISVAAPTDEEMSHHYLWRFWRHVPRAGYVTIYDRSWYGRVLVERVENFAREDEWMRAYHEINEFESQLVDHGAILLKFWLHLSPEEQLRRFKEREVTPWKQHKITDEDWRNRERWGDYEMAINDMVSRTSTEYSPWTLVPGNDKRYARVKVLETLCQRLEAAL